MDDQPDGAITRRRALCRTAAVGLGATVAWAAHAQAGKLAKDAVKYVDKGDVPGKTCDHCVQFVAPASAKSPATCLVVDGPISTHGHCIAFTPKA